MPDLSIREYLAIFALILLTIANGFLHAMGRWIWELLRSWISRWMSRLK